MIDPMELDQAIGALQNRVASIDARLDEHSGMLRTMAAGLNRLLQTQQVEAQVAPPAPPPAPVVPVLPEALATVGNTLRLPPPPRFDGTPEKCRGFLNQCKVQFELMPTAFVSERAKVGYVFSLLSERALAWAAPLWESSSPIMEDSDVFFEALRRVFDVPARRTGASHSLLNLRQGTRNLSDYTIQFRTWAAELGWNDEALTAAFVNGLSERLKDELASRDMPEDLEAVIALVARIDARLRERSFMREPRRPVRLAPRFVPPLSQPTPPPEEPMQLGFTRPSEEEKRRRRTLGLCFYCGASGHQIHVCPRLSGNGSA